MKKLLCVSDISRLYCAVALAVYLVAFGLSARQKIVQLSCSNNAPGSSIIKLSFHVSLLSYVFRQQMAHLELIIFRAVVEGAPPEELPGQQVAAALLRHHRGFAQRRIQVRS